MDATDNELIRRFQAGDDAAYRRLAERWETKVYALAFRMTLDAHDSEDIRQTAFLRAQRAMRTFDRQASFSTWLHRVVLNLCRDRDRSRRTRKAAFRRWLPALKRDAGVQHAPASAYECMETNGRVAEAVRALPQEVREVVIMRHYEDLKFARIGEIQQAPISTVKSRMAKGLRLLREQLEDIAP